MAQISEILSHYSLLEIVMTLMAAAFISGCALFYLVMNRTRRKRLAERMENRLNLES